MCFVSAQRGKSSLRSEASTGPKQVVRKPSAQAEEPYVRKRSWAFPSSSLSSRVLFCFFFFSPSFSQEGHLGGRCATEQESSAVPQFRDLPISVRFGLKFIVTAIVRNSKNCKRVIYWANRWGCWAYTHCCLYLLSLTPSGTGSTQHPPEAGSESNSRNTETHNQHIWRKGKRR